MRARCDQPDWRPATDTGLETPFASDGVLHESESEWEAEAARLESESPFREAFESSGGLTAEEEWTRERQPLEDDLRYEDQVPDEDEWGEQESFDERTTAEEDEGWLERDSAAFESPFEFEGPVPPAVTEFAERLGREWSRRANGSPSAEVKTQELLQDYRDTMVGAQKRFGARYSEATSRRAWMISRQEEMGFRTSGWRSRRLRNFAAPTGVQLRPSPLVLKSERAPVAPIMERFVEELRRRHTPYLKVDTYRRHGGAGFRDRGHSVDLWLRGTDSRGFHRPDDAMRLLRAIHEAARAVQVQWRVIYNDFGVADAMNRETGQENVIFVGTVRRDSGQIVGLNWHGPAPFILHFHLDIAPLGPGSSVTPGPVPTPPPRPPAPAPPTGVDRALVRFAQSVLNATEGERLAVDGVLGPKTRTALERFRRLHGLGAGGVLDDRTVVALVQRALEELAQQSMFAKGVRDQKTDQAVASFKRQHGLPGDATLDAATRAALLEALRRRAAPAQPSQQTGPITDWTRVSGDQRMAHVMRVLVDRYRYPVNGAAGLVGNLWEESGVLPNRIEGSSAATPMRARNFANVVTDFTPDQVMNRNRPTGVGPRLPGIGLAQWTSAGRRAGLFRHSYQGQVLGAAILGDMDAQVDYLVSELGSSYRTVDALLRNPATTLEGASDEVVYSFEVPGSALSEPDATGRRQRLPRTHPSVQAVFRRRRESSRRALAAYRAAGEASREAAEALEDEAVDLEMRLAEEQLDEAHIGEQDEEREHGFDLEAEEDEGIELETDEEAEEGEDVLETRELDPSLLDTAERIMAREAPFFEGQVASRWTTCFSAADIAKVEKVYQDNDAAASGNSVDRCSCIVMLNVALGQLLSLGLKANRARGASTRIVQMGNLTTKSIEKAMQQLRRRGHALAPTILNFFDRRNRTAGTLKPERLKASVQAKILSLATKSRCWFAFGLSIMDGYHSVLLLVDRTGSVPRIFWLDQFSPGITDDVTTTLDQRITDKTQAWWQAVMDQKGKGYNTTIRIWRLRKRR